MCSGWYFSVYAVHYSQWYLCNESLNKLYELTEQLFFFVRVGTNLSFLAHQTDLQIYGGRGVFINLLSANLCTTKKTWALNFGRYGNQEIRVFEAWVDVGL